MSEYKISHINTKTFAISGTNKYVKFYLKFQKISFMKIIRLLIMLTAFLIMISSAYTLYAPGDRTPVYVNVAAMACLIAIITLLNFQNKDKSQR